MINGIPKTLNKLSFSKSKCFKRLFWILVIRYLNLFRIWCLGFRISFSPPTANYTRMISIINSHHHEEVFLLYTQVHRFFKYLGLNCAFSARNLHNILINFLEFFVGEIVGINYCSDTPAQLF